MTRTDASPISRRVWGWVASSSALVALLGGGMASVVSISSGAEMWPIWGRWTWWAATAVFALVLLVMCGRPNPTGRRFVVASVAAAVTYIGVGGVLEAASSASATGANTAPDWIADLESAMIAAVWLWGNGAVAVAAPLVLGLLPIFRPALLGAPARWSNSFYTVADEDAAAEDFNIY